MGLASSRRTTEQGRDPGCLFGGWLWSSEWRESKLRVGGSSQQRPQDPSPLRKSLEVVWQVAWAWRRLESL